MEILFAALLIGLALVIVALLVWAFATPKGRSSYRPLSTYKGAHRA